MRRWIPCLVLAGVFAFSTSRATSPGQRLSAEDIVVHVPGLTVTTSVPVDLNFDYSSCDAYPSPADLRCGLFARGGFDASGLQYAIRSTHSPSSAILPRTEIWRTTPAGGSELLASLDPRPVSGPLEDDGRLEQVAVDAVHGCIHVLLSSSCFPPNARNCPYSPRATEIVKICGLPSLADVLNGGSGAPSADGPTDTSTALPFTPGHPLRPRPGSGGSR